MLLQSDRQNGPSETLSRKVRLTTRLLDSLQPNLGGRRLTIYDNTVPGLCVVINATSKSFYVYRRVNRRPVRLRLGTFPTMSVEQAKRLAQKYGGEIAEGKDPRDQRNAVRKAATLGAVWTRWVEEYAKARHTAKTRFTDANRYDTCLKPWAGRQMLLITESDVRELHAGLAKDRGNVTANRAIQLLRRLFNFARIRPNPAGGRAVDFFSEQSRERFLQPDELPRFFKALDEEPNSTLRDFFYSCLWTGQRRGNVSSMRWDEVHLASATWSIPSEKTKNHKPHHVHLVRPMLELLRRRNEEANIAAAAGDKRHSHGFVFPTYRYAAKTLHLSEPKSAWKRILKNAGLTDLRIHDLRRSLGSWAAMTGASTLIIGKALGHLDPSSTAIYARLNLDPVRSAVEMAIEAMQAVAESPPQSQAKIT